MAKKIARLPAKSKTALKKIITVKNADGDPDTTATIVIQNKIKYTPKVSVIIPVYNVEQYLRECLDSVVNQTLREIEIICVDDGSTDSSLDILKEYASKDNRITVIKQQNLHAGVARNAGLAVARGEYVHFLDSDDWVSVDNYSKLYDITLAHKANVIKFCSYSFDDKTKQVVDTYFTRMGAVDVDKFDSFLTLKKDYATLINISDAPWSGIYKRNFLNSNNIKFDNLLCANDTSFFYRCLVSTDSIYLVGRDKRFVYYRINNSTSLIGIRAYHFDCQLKQFDIIDNIVSSIDNNQILQKVRQHLIHAIFYRYDMYIKNTALKLENRKKLFDQLSEFIKKIQPSEIDHTQQFNAQTLNKKPCVSVIIPIYNAEKWLEQCLDSVINQTLYNIEIICINDCSTDNSSNILEKYAQKDNRIMIINNKKNSGAPGIVKNLGLKYVTGEYIGFVDSDDYIDLDYFENLYREAKTNDADIASSLKLTHIYQNKSNSKILHCSGSVLITPEQKSSLMCTGGSNCLKIYRTSFIKNNNIICCEIRNVAEDNYFSMISMCLANKIVTTDKSGYYYRHRENSITSEKRTDKDFAILDIYKNIDDFITNHYQDKKVKSRYLDALNIRKQQDLSWFLHDCDSAYLDAFKNKLKQVFPDIYSKIVRLPLIVSLTSYPARIGTINQTIESLLNQTMKADKVILWLAPEQFPNREGDLPQQLLDLCNKGLTIDWYHDIRSYKKLNPTLKKYPDAIIVTADDDNIYQPTWLEKLYASYSKHPHDIHAHRVTKFYCDATGFKTIAGGHDYWPGASCLNKLVGLGGVLYPPHCFYKDILNEDLIKKLAPTNDDQWYWFMGVLNGYNVRVVEAPEIEAHYVPGTQETGLCKINDAGPKLFWRDFRALLSYYPQIYKILKTEADKKTLNRPEIIPYKTELENWYMAHRGTINLDKPKTFNEKIQWLKLFASTPDKTRLADKYLVRDWVSEKIGEEYLIPLLGVYDKFEEIDFKKLPKRFVIKCNHGCGYNIIVKDKSSMDLEDIKNKLNKWMNENFAFRVGCELHYRDITPKIIIEQYIENKKSIGGDLYDYKFWCFDGRVHYIQFLSERNTDGLKMAFYNRKWKKQKFVYSHPLDTKTIERPDNLDEMIELAEKLSAGFNHVRVDFYRMDDGTIYFGEMTFTSASGMCKWNDEKINRYFGKLIKLPKLAYNIDTGEYYKLPKIKKQKKDKKEKQQKKKRNIKPYLLFPYYLITMVFMKYIKIPVLKFVKHTKQIWYSHSHRGKMDMLNKNFTNIMQSVTSVKNDMTNQITQIKNQQSNLEKQIADLRHTTGVKSNDLSQQIADFQSNASQNNDALAQKIIDLNTVTENKSNDLSQQIADFQSNASQNNDALVQKIIDLNTVTENKSNDLSQQIADFQSNASQNSDALVQKIIDLNTVTENKSNDLSQQIADFQSSTSQSNDVLAQKIIDLINTTNGIPDTIAQHASEQIKAIQHNVETLNQQNKDTQSNIINTVDQIKKHADELTVMNSEPYWAHVYHDTTANTTWLKNKSVSPGRWAISYIVLYVLYRILDEAKPKSILECGLGQSSKLTIQYADSHNADLTICENNPEWLSFFQRQFPTADKYTTILDTEMVKIVPEHESRTYANFKPTIGNKKFNLVLIDGPLGSPHYSRPEILDIVDNLDKSFVILLDDMNRIGEQEIWQLLKQKLHSKGIEFKERKYSSDKTVGLICSMDLAYLTSL